MPRDRHSQTGNVSPSRLELLITICEKGKAGFYADLIQSFGCNIQFTSSAMGTADTAILRMLGLSQYEQSAIFSIVREDKTDEIMETLESKFRSIKGGKGIAMTVPFSSVIGKTVFGFLSNDRRTEGEVSFL